jgi:hypothetical protein
VFAPRLANEMLTSEAAFPPSPVPCFRAKPSDRAAERRRRGAFPTIAEWPCPSANASATRSTGPASAPRIAGATPPGGATGSCGTSRRASTASRPSSCSRWAALRPSDLPPEQPSDDRRSFAAIRTPNHRRPHPSRTRRSRPPGPSPCTWARPHCHRRSHSRRHLGRGTHPYTKGGNY